MKALSLQHLMRLAPQLAMACLSANAQWLHYPTPGIPRTRDGKADLSAPAPRAANQSQT